MRKNIILFATFLLAFQALTLSAQNTPKFLDTSLDVDTRVEDLISRLPLDKKARLLNHRGDPVEVEGYTILSDGWNQCLHGVLWTEPTTVFPTSTAFGATWDTDLIHEVATAISDEARAIYNGWHLDPNAVGEHKGLIYRSPVINISRNPYWGRINEIYGEDPYHTGEIGVSFVTGIQGDDPKYLKLASTLKHYAVNNVEVDRQKLSADVSERMLHEYWLPHFKKCVVDGKAQSLMASYNAINGTPNNINYYLLTTVLKQKWGHEGFVVSDLGGVRTMVQGHQQNKMSYPEAVGKSVMAGTDFSDSEYEKYIPEAVLKGYLTEERLNDALRRVLKVRFRLGEFDKFEDVPYSKIPMSVIGCDEHIALARKTAQESIVLLKNNGVLPLDKSKLKKVAVMGPYADIFNVANYGGKPTNAITPLEGIKAALGDDVQVEYLKAAYITPELVRRGHPMSEEYVLEEQMAKAEKLAKTSDAVILFVGTTSAIEVEGKDRKTLRLPGTQEELIHRVCSVNKNVIVFLMSAGPLAVPEAKQKAGALLQGWWPGEQGGPAIADVIFGDYNPGGKLPYTMYASDAQVPSTDIYDISKGFTYMYVKGKPQYAFGYGLSYTTFSISDLKLSATQADADDVVKVSVKVKNTGKVKGDEVVQLYTAAEKSKVVRPVKELKGFKRITLNPGEEKVVEMELPVSSLAYYDEAVHDFVVEPLTYSIMVGNSSDAIKARKSLIVK